VAAEIHREPAALWERLLRQAAIALAMCRDAVDGERGRAVGRAVVVKVQDSHGAEA
jgi:hypothetical protein